VRGLVGTVRVSLPSSSYGQRNNRACHDGAPSDGHTVIGSMSRDNRPRHWQLSSGATLLDEHDDDVDARTCRGHTLSLRRGISQADHMPPGPAGPPSIFRPAAQLRGSTAVITYRQLTARSAPGSGISQGTPAGPHCVSGRNPTLPLRVSANKFRRGGCDVFPSEVFPPAGTVLREPTATACSVPVIATAPACCDGYPTLGARFAGGVGAAHFIR